MLSSRYSLLDLSYVLLRMTCQQRSPLSTVTIMILNASPYLAILRYGPYRSNIGCPASNVPSICLILPAVIFCLALCECSPVPRYVTFVHCASSSTRDDEPERTWTIEYVRMYLCPVHTSPHCSSWFVSLMMTAASQRRLSCR